LAIALWVFRSIGLEGVGVAARHIGWGGALLYIRFSIGLFVVLGAAWLISSPDAGWRQIGLYSWARLIREAVADLLPFSQIGGIVVGTRVLIGHGIVGARVYAAMIVDMTTEMASQLLFTLFGLVTMASLLLGAHGAGLRSAVLAGSLALLVIVLLFVLGQRPLIAFASKIAAKLLPQFSVALDALESELDRAYAKRQRVALSFLLNLIGWIGTGTSAWILLYLAGTPIPFVWALAIESLIATVRSVAFAVPGAIGFQEGAYALVGPLFGLPAETALALALAKRARDVAIGLPALLLWQITEARSVLAARGGA